MTRAMREDARAAATRRVKGSLLIVTLWLIALLAVLAVAIGRFLSLEVRLAGYRAARQQARALARGGVYVAMERLARDAAAPEAGGASYDWLGDEWAALPSSDELTVEIRDDARGLDLNAASKEQLARLTGQETIAQAIVDARDAPDAAEDQPGASPPYFAKNASFAAPEELRDLPGMSSELYALLAAQTSPYRTATEPVNLNTATPEVLRAVGLTEPTIQLLLRFREGLDGPDAHAEDGVFEQAGVAVLETLKNHQGVELTGTADGNLLISNLFGVTSTTFTIRAEGRVAQPPVTARVSAVVRREGCGDGVAAPCIVAWREG